MDIIVEKDKISSTLNIIVSEYIDINKKYTELNETYNKLLKDDNKNLEIFNNQLNRKDELISKLNRDKCEYEKIINGLNDKIDTLISDKESEDKHSILINQANQLEEKDRIIEQLQNKLSKYVDKNKVVDDSIKVFTDGACSNNGQENAKAGIGIYFADNDIRNVSERIDGEQTNNNAELNAIVRVFDVCKNIIDKNKNITIYTDSKYSISCFMEWSNQWVDNDWKNKNGDVIQNKQVIIDGYNLFKKYKNVKLEYVKAHTNNMDELSVGNRMADKLAKESLDLPDIVSLDDIINIDSPVESNETVIDYKPDDKHDDQTDNKPDNNNYDKPDDKPYDKQIDDSNNIDDDTESLSDDDDEVWIKVKHKKIAYYIVKDEEPQYVYSIIDNKKGDKLGYREMYMSKDKKKYKYTFY